MGRAQLVGPFGQERAQQGHIARLADGVAHRVQLQRDLPQAEPGEEVVRQRHHLDVHVGVGHAQHLHAQLVVLAVAALLGVLVAERGRHVPGLPGRDRVVLHERPHDRGGALGAQGHHLAVTVLEDVHLLADDLAPLPMPRRKTPACSRTGVSASPYAAPSTSPAKRATVASQRSDSGHSTSCMPLGVRAEVAPAASPPPGATRTRAAQVAPHRRGVTLSCQAADDRRRRHRPSASAH